MLIFTILLQSSKNNYVTHKANGDRGNTTFPLLSITIKNRGKDVNITSDLDAEDAMASSQRTLLIPYPHQRRVLQYLYLHLFYAIDV